MGLFDFIRNEFIEVIDWVDSSNDTIVYKFPDKGNKIMNGAQLTVRESQVVVLMNEGEFGDVYQPGRMALTTQNMPIVTTLKSWKYLFDSPFKVDIYYVVTRQFTNLKWGTSAPIIMRDATFGQVRLRSFGSYTMHIADPKKFIKVFAGTNPQVRVDELGEQLRNVIISRFAEWLAKANLSLLDVAANFSQLGETLKPVLQEEFDTWGVALDKFYIENVTLPEEVEALLDKSTGVNILSDKLNKFNQMQAGIAIEKMADNPGAASTAGIGAGVIFSNLLQPQQQQPAAAPVNATDDKQKMLDLLKQLGELKAAGVITEEEFNQKKTEILSKL